MKAISLLILVTISWAVNSQSIDFELCICRGLYECSLRNDSLTAKGLGFKIDTVISKEDSDSLQVLFNEILKTPGNEAWLNICVDDGLHLKFVLITENRLKKVYVGNYYEARLNSIALILNSYLKRTKKLSGAIPYGRTDKEAIREKIESQNNCKGAPDGLKKDRLYSWCKCDF